MKTEVYELVMFKGNPIRITKTQYQAVMEDSSSGKMVLLSEMSLLILKT